MAAEAGDGVGQQVSEREPKSVLPLPEVKMQKPDDLIPNNPSFITHSVLGHYSQDLKCRVHMDDREACEISDGEFEKLEPEDKNLNGDHSNFTLRSKGTEADGLKPVMKWILHKMSSGDGEVKKYMRPSSGVTFVFKRAVMTRILNAPYEHHPEIGKWRLIVCRLQNIIYVCNDQTFIEWKTYSDQDMERRYWAAKFESLITHPIHKKTVRKNWKLDDCAGYVIVVGTQLETKPPEQAGQTGQAGQTRQAEQTEQATQAGLTDAPKISFILFAEVDAEEKGTHTTNDTGGLPPAASNCIELKRTYERSRMAENFFRHTLRKTWSQCCSVGTPRIVYGFHDEKGILQGTKTFRTDELPALCRKETGKPWSDAVCLDFADAFTKWLAEEVKEELREYTVTFEPRGCEKQTPRSLVEEVKEELRENADTFEAKGSEKPKPRTTGRMLLRTDEINDECPSILTPEFVEEMERYGARP